MKGVKKLLKHAEIKKGDIVYDLGAGDGRYVHLASKLYGAESTGFELNIFLYLYAKFRQWISAWQGKMVYGNFLKHNLSNADVVICYLMPNSLKKYQEKFEKELKKGTKVLSYSFKVGEWKEKKILPPEGRIKKIVIYEV